MFAAVVLVASLFCPCHREPVSCEFVGAVGQKFMYEGRSYVVPKSRSIELISEYDDRCTSIPLANRVPLPHDPFGKWTMRLPLQEKK